MIRLRKKGLSIMILSVVVLLAAACGEAKTGDPSARPIAGNSSAEPSDSAAPNAQQTRIVHDIVGDVVIPVHPERIVAPYVEDALVALGVTPALQWSLGSYVQDYLQPYLEDVPFLDFTDGPNLEALLAADPDIIVLYTSNLAKDGGYEQFGKIAPTYAFEDATVSWKDTLHTLGDILGKQEEANAAIQAYEDKLEEAKAVLQPYTEGKTFAVIRVKPKEFLLMDGTYYSGPVLYDDLGLEPHPLIKELSWDYNYSFSLELLPDLDADYIFLLVQGEAARDKAVELRNSSLWQDLPAVKNNHVFEVDISYWMAAGAIAHGKKIDDVVKLITQQ